MQCRLALGAPWTHPKKQVHEIAAILPRFFDALVGAAALAARAVAIAGELDHPVYGCLYVTLAEARQARLVTADARLLGKLRGTSWEAKALNLTDYQTGP